MVAATLGDLDGFAMLQTRRLIVLTLAVLASGGYPASVPAQTAANVFQVSGIEVDVTAADAVAARREALLEGQAEGLRRLMRRLTPAAEYGRLPSIEPATVERYVQNFEIASEQVAATQYRAQLNVRYDPDAVRDLLKDEALGFAETTSMAIVVLPLYQAPDGPRLWPDGNPWWQAWADNLDPERLLRLVLPLGDLEDMGTVTVEQVEAGDPGALSTLAGRYGTEDVLLVVATPLRGAETTGETSLGALGGRESETAITATGEAPALSLEMRRVGLVEQANPAETIEGAPGQTLEALMAETVVGLQNTLDERWKNANLLRYDQAGIMVVDIPIARLSDWVEINRGLQGLPEVSQVEIATFARDNVRVQIRYIGDEFRLEQAFARIGLALSREGESWLLLPSEARPSQGEPPSAASTSF